MRKLLASFWRAVTAPFRWLKKALAFLFRPVQRLSERLHIFWEDESEATARPIGDVVSQMGDEPRAVLNAILEHIFEFRKHLLRGLIGLALTTTISFIFAEQILDFLAIPIGGTQNLEAVEVTENVGIFMRVSLLAGFTAALPYLLFELMLYIAPALRPRHRRTGLASIPAVVFLFLAGMAFTYYVLLSPALNFLVTFMDIPTQVRPASYFPFATGLMFWIGLAFEFPIIILLLSLFGWVKAGMLLRHARIAVVVLAVFAAMITPTVDPVNMILVWGPLVGLYFIGAWFAYLGERWRLRQERQAAKTKPTPSPK